MKHLRRGGLLISIFIIILLFCWYLIYTLNHLNFYSLPGSFPSGQKIVVQICLAKEKGGMERCALAQQEALLAAGVTSILVCAQGSFLELAAQQRGLPAISCSPRGISLGHVVWMPGLTKAIQHLYSTYSGYIIATHCNYKREVFVAKEIETSHHIPIVLTQHTPARLPQQARASVDGIVAVSPHIQQILKELNQRDNVSTPLTIIPPFFDVERLFYFALPKEERTAYFKEKFNISLLSCPLLLKVAHLYRNIHHKNHPLLFEAMHDLIYKKNIEVQAILAGEGPNLKRYKKMVQALGLTKYVHFLGNTENIAALFHYADINLLASTNEAFGITLIEGGLMKKPTIIAQNTGAAHWLISDHETGFLFKTNDSLDLANTIAYVLSHPEIASQCGEHLYKKIVSEFLPARSAQTLLLFYDKLRKNT